MMSRLDVENAGLRAGRRFAIGFSMALLAAGGCTVARDHPAAVQSAFANLRELPPAARQPSPPAADHRLVSGAAVPLQVLVLSSGGVNGAFPAGVLVGWSQSGTRPNFDVVTGVSVGSLLAVYAFLGREYDAELERRYATMEASELYQRRAIVTLPWSDALADSKPLRDQIVSAITPEVLESVAEEHRRGRRLYVGTTNVDTQRLVVWDMGAVAAGEYPDKLDLFHTVLLASCSIPALLPPVPINVEVDGKHYTELHTDGSVSASLFLLPQMLGLDPSRIGEGRGGDASIYVLIAGKLAPETAAVPRRLFNVADASLRGMMQAQMESDLQRLFMLSRAARAGFNVMGISQDLSISKDPLSADARAARALFEEGRKRGAANGPWHTTPPGIAPADWQQPRTGVRFISDPNATVGSGPG